MHTEFPESAFICTNKGAQLQNLEHSSAIKNFVKQLVQRLHFHGGTFFFFLYIHTGQKQTHMTMYISLNLQNKDTSGLVSQFTIAQWIPLVL